MAENNPRPINHNLKTWPEYFQAIINGRKTFEVRKDDRGYEVDDWLILREWNPETEQYTGRILHRKVSYIMRGGQFGLLPGYVIMGFNR